MKIDPDPAFHRHYAKVMIAEAKKRRATNQPGMVKTLVQWARNGRRRYWEAHRALHRNPDQGDLFA